MKKTGKLLLKFLLAGWVLHALFIYFTQETSNKTLPECFAESLSEIITVGMHDAKHSKSYKNLDQSLQVVDSLKNNMKNDNN